MLLFLLEIVPNLAPLSAPSVDETAANIINNGAASSVVHGLSFLQLFWQADSVVKGVMLLLLFLSIWTWTVIFEKAITIRLINSRIKRFERDFWSGMSLERMFKQCKGREDNPLAMVFTAVIDEINVKSLPNKTTTSLKNSERIKQAAQIAASKAMDNVEHNLDFLAMIGSTATFIGLFGTVWGIMVSFQSIAAAKNTTLAVVAPGIAEALLATVLGLVAAIPAMLFYNKFVSSAAKISNKVQIFCIEMVNIVMRELEE